MRHPAQTGKDNSVDMFGDFGEGENIALGRLKRVAKFEAMRTLLGTPGKSRRMRSVLKLSVIYNYMFLFKELVCKTQ